MSRILQAGFLMDFDSSSAMAVHFFNGDSLDNAKGFRTRLDFDSSSAMAVQFVRGDLLDNAEEFRTPLDLSNTFAR